MMAVDSLSSQSWRMRSSRQRKYSSPRSGGRLTSGLSQDTGSGQLISFLSTKEFMYRFRLSGVAVTRSMLVSSRSIERR